MPETFAGWIGIFAALVLTVSALIGLIVWFARPAIEKKIEGMVESMIGKEVASAATQTLIMAEVKTLSVNLESASRTLATVERLEIQINNGLREDVKVLKDHAEETGKVLAVVKAHLEGSL